MGSAVTETSRSLPSLDLDDPTEARLTSCARRIGQLLKSPAVAANTDVESSLDDFLGALYTLIRAKHEGFRDRPGRPIAIKPIAQRAARIAGGNLKMKVADFGGGDEVLLEELVGRIQVLRKGSAPEKSSSE